MGGPFPPVTDLQRFEVIKNGAGAPTGVVLDRQRGIIHNLPGPQSATLDTPERQEYEAAKREGRTVPDPFADPFRNATPEQRERMAEQRAAIAAEKARRGLPAKIAAVEALNEAGLISPDDVETVVSTEELATGANGSFGAAVSVTATDEKLSPEESDG